MSTAHNMFMQQFFLIFANIQYLQRIDTAGC